METVGIICEYNPFHNGHLRQFQLIREKYGRDSTIICLMSGISSSGAHLRSLIKVSVRRQPSVPGLTWC